MKRQNLPVKEAAYAGKTEDEIRALDSRALTKYYGSGNDADSLNISAIEGTSTFSSDSIKSDISGVVRDYASVTDRTYALNGSPWQALDWQILKLMMPAM